MKRVRRIEGRCLVVATDNIDTDQIIPARFLKTISRDGLGDGAFYDWRFDKEGRPRPDSPFDRPASRGAAILVAGQNFGCGSSREHAAWALSGFGFQAVVARSFADIFRQNALKNGLVPVALPLELHAALAARLASEPDVSLSIDLERQVLTLPGDVETPFEIDPFARECLLDGVDEIGYVLGQDAAISSYEIAHPTPFDTRADSAPA